MTHYRHLKPIEARCACNKIIVIPTQEAINKISKLNDRLIGLWEQRSVLGPLDEIVADIEHTNHEIAKITGYLDLEVEMSV